jgi:L-threonylcarbamoyladenylate synthase
MKTILIPISDSGWPSKALAVIKSGGMVAFPTDTVYGLGASAFNASAVKKIYKAKGRQVEKSIPILLGDIVDLEKVSSHISQSVMRLASHFWPGPLTIIVNKHPDIPKAVSNSATVGLRIPNHLVAEKLLRAAGPMAVTSANLSGNQNPHSAADVMAQLDGRIDMIIDGGDTGNGPASTVINCMGVEPQIIREGPISIRQVLEVLRN